MIKQITKPRLSYDLICKEIISNKTVIAKILKKLVFDFKDLSIDTIKEECLLSDDKDKNKVKQTNRKVGDINCDLLFDAYTPNNNKIR